MFAVHHTEQIYSVVYLYIGVPRSQRLYLELHISALKSPETAVYISFMKKKLCKSRRGANNPLKEKNSCHNYPSNAQIAH